MRLTWSLNSEKEHGALCWNSHFYSNNTVMRILLQFATPSFIYNFFFSNVRKYQLTEKPLELHTNNEPLQHIRAFKTQCEIIFNQHLTKYEIQLLFRFWPMWRYNMILEQADMWVHCSDMIINVWILILVVYFNVCIRVSLLTNRIQ